MHELSIVENFVRSTDDFARSKGIERVKFVTLIVGGATGIEPPYLHMYYPEVCEGTTLEGSELHVEEVETECFCRNCGNVWNPPPVSEHLRTQDDTVFCPECLERDYDLLHGNELTIKEIGYEDE